MAAPTWTTQIHAAKRFRLGTLKTGVDNGVYMYGAGVASNVAGAWCVFLDASTWVPTLLAADTAGPVGISMSANTSATNYSWYQVFGYNIIASSDTTAANKPLYCDGTAGRVDDATSAGDLVFGAFSTAADTSNVLPVFISFPYVTNSAYLT